jgi:hypothetical protein
MRLLLSARDPGAADHLRVIAQRAVDGWDADVTLVAAPPALGLWQAAGWPVEPFGADAVVRPSPSAVTPLLREASRILERVRPDAILVGLSHFNEAGVDEAFLACSGGLPTFAMQDFWGDVNWCLGAPARLYFVIDAEAARLTWERHRLRSEVVGSPKHMTYARLDALALRRVTRRRHGLDASKTVVGYFGQPLHELAGYRTTMTAFARAAARAFPNAVLLYRPHPRETPEMIAASRQHLADAELPLVLGEGGGAETWLAACDVVCSCYSTCCYDSLFLSRYASRPMAAVVYLLFDPEVQQHAQKVNGFATLPPVRQGLARCVEHPDDLESVLAEAASAEARWLTWRRARGFLPDVLGSADRILRRIRASLSESIQDPVMAQFANLPRTRAG